ncbi:MAG TPA: hypothetical protein VG649_21730 [Candidatus Angelobacter sp.]|jgi:hypothetical protein|nr:hypothetical protein [Candidatus Angelobacter sp.]
MPKKTKDGKKKAKDIPQKTLQKPVKQRKTAKPATRGRQATSMMKSKATLDQRECKPLPDAIDLVFSCGVPENAPLSEKLGTLFPSQRARDQFCQCVAKGVPTKRSNIPCGANNTLQNVVDSIKC